MRILIVDDEPDSLFLLRTILEHAGYQVEEASHGAQALDKVQIHPPDLVVTDLMMPVMNGRELILHLREDPRTAGIPILLVSTLPNRDEGADEVLEKPFRPNEILGVLSRMTEADG